MDFFEKLDQNPYQDLFWNVPDGQKQGTAVIIGGNSQNFRAEISTAEYLISKFPLKEVKVLLPDALKNKLPPLENLIFASSTETGSLADATEVAGAIDGADFALMMGDLSKNSVTERAVASACQNSAKPLILTRDAIDTILGGKMEQILMREELTFFASVAQLQKVFKSVYYPKVLMLSQSLIQVAEALHKFTLSYPAQIVTFHEGQILVAKNGVVKAVSLTQSGLSPLTLWNGELAARILALNLYNPSKFIEASVSAIFG